MVVSLHVHFTEEFKYRNFVPMEGDWGHNSIMFTGNSNAILCSLYVSLLHALSLY